MKKFFLKCCGVCVAALPLLALVVIACIAGGGLAMSKVLLAFGLAVIAAMLVVVCAWVGVTLWERGEK